MSATEYTPAPWAARDGYVVAIDYPGRVVARCGDYGEVFGASNADLIAASPDLLDVLERINAGEPVCSHASHWRGLVDNWDVHTDLCQAMTAAIAKAKGE